MELKDYQRRVLDDLEKYLDTLDATPNLGEAFEQYWASKSVTRIESYKNNVPGVPHICTKVPTAGGKTYIAVNALDVIFRALHKFNPQRPNFVVWLVPSLTILEQTVRNLSNSEHPYRKRLDQLFRHRVNVYEKRDLLMGAGFSADSVTDQMSIVVMTFDSLRARNKEDRKIYQENGYLASFARPESSSESDWLLADYDPSSLINVIRSLKPVVIVDESHNAETELSVEMLKNLNPDFILDLTATPRRNSNIISYVDALALKRQHMVKLPVIVANRSKRSEAIENALILRNQLERFAENSRLNGGKYIRPIILFQAQPRTADDNTTFTKIKERLISLNIPAEQIAIKTADINELKNVDLMREDCPIRYIITVNALKEGWDCPFAYILVSLADKTSAVDVEQIVGRILRVPYVQNHSNELLNMSYVFTASSRFMDTLQSVVKGLNRAGFTNKDYRAFDVSRTTSEGRGESSVLDLDLFSFDETSVTNNEQANQGDVSVQDVVQKTEHDVSAVDTLDDLSDVSHNWNDETGEAADRTGAGTFVDTLTKEAIKQNGEFTERAESGINDVPSELEDKMNRHRVKDFYVEEIKTFMLPQFFLKVQTGGWFDDDEAFQLLEQEELLRDFKLAQADATIRFDDVDMEMYRIDLEQIGNEDYSPKPFKVQPKERERLNQYILSIPREGQIRKVTARIVQLIGNMYPITDYEVSTYVNRIVQNLKPDQIRDCLERDFAYVRKIRTKIRELASLHAQKTFRDWLDVERVVVQPSFKFEEVITPSSNAPAIPKSLYITEAKMGDFEQRVIIGIANLDSVEWWHRNLSRGKGFRLNGYLNHYPDFIIKTRRGHIVALETKGDDRDNSDSDLKLKLGKLWEAKAGSQYRYMMVFENKSLEGAEKLADALNKLQQL